MIMNARCGYCWIVPRVSVVTPRPCALRSIAPKAQSAPGRVLWRYRGPVVRCSCSHFPQGGEWECFEMGSEAEGFASGVEHHAGGERVASLCLQAA